MTTQNALTAAEIQAISDVLNVAVPDADDTEAMATWNLAADAVSKLRPALDDVDRAAGWKALDGFGCFVRVENGVLQQAPADVDGEICADEIIDVSAADWDFLNPVNAILGTSFVPRDFAGR